MLRQKKPSKQLYNIKKYNYKELFKKGNKQSVKKIGLSSLKWAIAQFSSK
jgi:hypothetical protein